MKKLSVIFLLTIAVGACESQESSKADDKIPKSQATAKTDTTGKTLIVVNGMAIPESRIAAYSQEGKEINEEERELLIKNIITSELIFQAAKSKGMDSKESMRQQLAVAEQSILGRAYAAQFLENNPVLDEEVKAKYDELLQQFSGQLEYDAAHILVDEEEETKELLAILKKSPDKFSALAKEHSKDPGSAQNGGKLGWASPAGLVPPFAEAMQKTPNGEIYPEPVKTNFGWHIIFVADSRSLPPPPLDEKLKENLQQAIRAEGFSAHLDELREKATIERQ